MDTRYVKRRHKFYFAMLRPVAWLIASKYHYKTKPKRMKKGEQYLILSNHQSKLDPIFVALTFRAPVYFVATDSIFTTKWYSKLLLHCLSPIKKRKGMTDIASIRIMSQIAKEGGNIALFPEGNRAWCDFQFHMDRSVCKLVRMLKLPVLLYNFKGGYGVDPRWADNARKGKHIGEIKRILSLDEIKAMTDDELLQIIRTELKVIDSDLGWKFKSKRKAEFLERELFICSKCHSMSTLHSKGNDVICSHCGLKVTYGEDLHLHSDDEDFKFDKLLDWYKYQLEVVKNYQIVEGETICVDRDVEFSDKTTAERKVLASGTMTMDDKSIKVGDFVLPLDEITSGSPVNGRQMVINTKDKSYFVVGNERFNTIKYLLFFNVLCKNIRESGGDKYYGLSIDDGSC